MPSSRRIAANRATTRRSTGPRTAGGRLRASLKALKHGLAVPAAAPPALQHDIDHLARVLAGEAQDEPVVMVQARKMAEAAIDVQRARRARLGLLRAWDLSTGRPERVAPVKTVPDLKPVRNDLRDLARKVTDKETMRELKIYQSVAKQLDRVATVFKALQKMGPAPIYSTWDDLSHQLERLDRYERRSRSRCDRAIKGFDYMKTKVLSI
jgi:hypothetical protein